MTADLQPLLDAYADALTAFRDLAADLPEVDWGRQTDCPGWTVREQVAHVLAVEHMESGIAAVADLSPGELVARLAAAVDQHLGRLRPSCWLTAPPSTSRVTRPGRRVLAELNISP